MLTLSRIEMAAALGNNTLALQDLLSVTEYTEPPSCQMPVVHAIPVPLQESLAGKVLVRLGVKSTHLLYTEFMTAFKIGYKSISSHSKSALPSFVPTFHSEKPYSENSELSVPTQDSLPPNRAGGGEGKEFETVFSFIKYFLKSERNQDDKSKNYTKTKAGKTSNFH